MNPISMKADTVKDTSVPKANSRAKNSLPTKFALKKSKYGFGVFAKGEVALGSWFGPYEGQRIPVEEITKEMDMSYMWETLEDKEFKSVIDGKDENFSSWMRYINLARNEAEQNLCAFQYNDSVYYRSSKLINPNTELLVWYGKDFLSELGYCIFDSDHSIPIGRPEKLIKFVIESADLNNDPDDNVSSAYPHYVDVDALPVPMVTAEHSLSALKFEYVSSDEDKSELPSPYTSLMEKSGKEKLNTAKRAKRSNDKESSKRKSTDSSTEAANIPLAVNKKAKANKTHETRVTARRGTGNHFSIDISTKISKTDKLAGTKSKRAALTLSSKTGDEGKKRNSLTVDSNGTKTSKRVKNRKSAVANNGNTEDTKKHLSADNDDKRSKSSRTFVLNDKDENTEGKRRGSGRKRTTATNENRKVQPHTQMKKIKHMPIGKDTDPDFDPGDNQGGNLGMNDAEAEESSDTPNKGGYKCEECGQILSRMQGLQVHMRIHSGEKPFTCNECGKSFRQISNLSSHKISHSEERPHQCNQCDKKYRLASQLVDHMRFHTGERPFVCKDCGKSYHRIESLRTHQNKHKENRILHECDRCDAKFYYPSKLKVHQRVHTGEKPYTCNYCEKTFRRAQDLNLHKRIHTGEKPYECSECEWRFVSSSDLSKHKRTHSGVRPYECKECGKAFSFANVLASHMLIHTGKKEHVCSHCGKEFRRSSDLVMHLTTHSDDRPFKCDICRSSFKRKWLLTQHTRGHAGIKPYKCDQCDKAFTYSSDLTKHAVIHSGSKPFSCEKCKKKFSAAVSLKRHLLIHSGERPHGCTFCKKAFRRKHHLDGHLKRYHRNDS